MHLIESIGPVLGIAAFLGLAILAFILFQQGRDIRRLREWAGRAPERAQEAAEAVQATAGSSRGEAVAGEEEAAEEAPATSGAVGRLGGASARILAPIRRRLEAVDRRLPVDGRYLLAIAVVLVTVAGVLTSGFGLAGGGHADHRKHRPKPMVAILNGTAVSNLAARIDNEVVKPAGYKSGAVTNAGTSFANTVVMFLPGDQGRAKSLATAIRPKLGATPTQGMTATVKARAGGAPLALAVGLDDSGFGSG